MNKKEHKRIVRLLVINFIAFALALIAYGLIVWNLIYYISTNNSMR